MRKMIAGLLLMGALAATLTGCGPTDETEYVVWAVGSQRPYRTGTELAPVDSTVNVNLGRRGAELSLHLSSTDLCRTIRWNYAGSVKFKDGVVTVALLGIDGSRASWEARGEARSEIPLPDLPEAFDLEITYEAKKDRYRIELTNAQYRYRRMRGGFTQIADHFDSHSLDGIAKVLDF